MEPSSQALGADWTLEDATVLEAALAAAGGKDRALGYCELAGFLFALACSPELVRPSQWLPAVLSDAQFAAPEEANRVVGLVMALYNRINLDVLEGKPALPALIDVKPQPEANFGPHAPLGKWSAGFGAGQLWTETAWEARVAAAPESERVALDEALGGLNAVLAFFTHRELGEKFRRKMPGSPSLEVAARRTLAALQPAMQALAELGAYSSRERTP